MSMRTQSPSDADLAAAYDRVRRADWPPLHDLTVAATRFNLVRAAALSHANGTPTRAREAAPCPNEARPVQPPPPAHPPQFDHKRAAAGDRDDD